MPVVHKHLLHGTFAIGVVAAGLYAATTVSSEAFVIQDISYAIGRVSFQSVRIPETPFDTTLLLQADKQNYLGQYTPTDLVTVTGFPSMNLREEAAIAFDAMRNAAQKEDISLRVISAYRSYTTQQALFARYSSVYGEEAANTFSARAGYSEHQLGTTIDFGNNDANDLTKEFENTLQGQWLMENAHHYGFVMSYPSGKEEITGYIYEPWHYRYIGTKYSYDFMDSGLTLNQYLANLAE